MRIKSIEVISVLGVASAEIRAERPVVLIAGHNGAGKSSISEAIRQAFTGETSRGVEHKKDYAQLVNDGAESGVVHVEWEGGNATLLLPQGKRDAEGSIEGDKFVRYCVQPEAFASTDEKTRRTVLFDLMGVKITKDAVKEKLVDRGVDMKKAERALPLLAAGFDAACTEAKAKARDAKASWKSVTGGQTWGKEKAPNWQPPALEADAEQAKTLAADAEAKSAELDIALADVQRRIGEATAAENQRKANAAKRAELNEKADKAKRYGEKLAIDEAELKKWEQKVAETKAAAGTGPDPSNPGKYLLRGLAAVAESFLVITKNATLANVRGEVVGWNAYEGTINRAAVHLEEYRKLHGDPSAEVDREAAAKLPEYENALALMKSAVENGRRNLEDCFAAGKALGALGVDKPGEDIEVLKAKANEITEQRRAVRADADKYRDIAAKAASRDATIAKAAEHHADVMAWDAIAQAFAPDGIQAEFLADAMKPFNNALYCLSMLAQWPVVQVRDDMEITVDGRLYRFRSESEQWRTDAIIAAAIAKLSGLRFIMLDRFDVLDNVGRTDALYWLDDMAQQLIIDSAIVLGTLRAKPEKLPENIGAVWIEKGVAAQ